MKTTKPKIDIDLNESVTLKLIKDKALVGNSSYGEYYMYSVQEGDTEKVLFATSDVHAQILESGLKSGDSFELRKVAVQNGSKLSSKFEFSVLKKNGNGQEHHESEDSDNYRTLMKKSLEDSIEVTKTVNTIQWDVDSIRAIALTLFIQRSRTNC